MNWSELFTFSLQAIVNNIFGGNALLAGLWIVMILFGIGLSFRIEFSILLSLLIPAVIVFMATGLIGVLPGGIIILLVGFALAFSWWQKS